MALIGSPAGCSLFAHAELPPGSTFLGKRHGCLGVPPYWPHAATWLTSQLHLWPREGFARLQPASGMMGQLESQP